MRLAVRRLLGTPGFSITAVVTFAICLGANLTIFAVVDAILLRPLPFPDSDRLMMVYNSYPGAGLQHAGASLPNYFERRGAIRAFSSVALYQEASLTVGDTGSPRRVPMSRVTSDFFSTLGVPLAMGKMFTEANYPYGADQVAVLTDEFWRTQFNADPNVVGRTFLNDGLTVTVVGVLPRGFRFLSSRAEFYRPAAHDKDDRLPRNRHNEGGEMVARLAPGFTAADAQEQMNAFNNQQMRDDPYAAQVKPMGYTTVVTGLHQDFVHSVRPMLLLVQCGVLFLLLIGCVNLANLVLVRAGGRSREFAIRQALGAGRRHLFLDALAETTLLSLAGALCGLLLGGWGIELMRSLGTGDLPLGELVRFDWRVVAAALGAALAVGWILAAAAVLVDRGGGSDSGLRTGSRGGTSTRSTQWLRHGFIVGQVALTFVLLAAAGLLVVSLRHVLDEPAGFNPSNILSGQIALPWKSYKDGPSRLAFVERMLPAIRALPGVEQVSINTALPFTNAAAQSGVAIEGITGGPGQTIRTHEIAAVSSGYWQMMGIRLLRGRLLADADNHCSVHVCVVDEAFAERYWPKGDALGHRLTPFDAIFRPDQADTIVGVVSSARQNDLAEPKGVGLVYLPFSLSGASFLDLAVRTRLPVAAMAPMIRKAVLQLDPDLPISDLRAMQSRIDDSLVTRRSPTILAGIFSGVALLLAAVGTYGVLSYAVSQRRREIGVRMALGAQPRQVRNQFLGMGLGLLAAGVLLGTVGAWGASRAMQSVLYGVPALPAPILIGAATMLGAVAITACLLPARRASKVDPMVALQAE
ncbi:MAG TPA: ABC transporter permease [Opitutaceae bacterium]